MCILLPLGRLPISSQLLVPETLFTLPFFLLYSVFRPTVSQTSWPLIFIRESFLSLARYFHRKVPVVGFTVGRLQDPAGFLNTFNLHYHKLTQHQPDWPIASPDRDSSGSISFLSVPFRSFSIRLFVDS